jgi:hypothetical protein
MSPLSSVAHLAAVAARLCLVLLVVAGLADGDRTVAVLGVVFAVLSYGVSRIAPPVLDLCLALLLLAHGWGSLLGPADDIGAWGPAMHVLAPVVVGAILVTAAAEGRGGLRPHALGAALVVGFAASVVVLVGWEALEETINRLPGVHVHTARGDTIEDLTLGVIGAAAGCAAAVAGLALSRRRGSPRGPALP